MNSDSNSITLTSGSEINEVDSQTGNVEDIE
jgi:hypothetical protein